MGAMEHIWAPWRIEYLQKAPEGGCFLCQKPAENQDEESLILYRGRHNFVIMNTFPYNPGHLLVAPYRHASDLQVFSDDEAKEHFEIIRKTLTLLREVMDPTGFNIGVNLGRVAGAGVPDHIHTHIVPRWGGDTNFMPVVCDTKVLPEALAGTYRKLRARLWL
jgi:ATP adenylyltransferase